MCFETATDSEVKEWVETQIELRTKLLSECKDFRGKDIVYVTHINSVLIYKLENLLRISRVMGLELEIEDISDIYFEAVGKIIISDIEFFSYLWKGDKNKWVKH